ncbi:FAD-binding oxidoreductase [Micromonospora sp. PPF5-17]|uniref:FAD-binding oxidoreductase n=2 Tax=Micromonosporaceae TaxID=28056 RepID=A0ABX9WD65_9ACTN|nr:FAD-binding oxidoreductase [Micromonospora sp. PPF5-17B]NES38066.1 FAD-binding oxidoreductase [Micromonospora solifontis]NES56645.1 FAD-binding oxidoreductase [Micromonospora sp. PPF5-6]RNL97072.1 FAD-binding oxidoreductase [Micromonospora solifontis]
MCTITAMAAAASSTDRPGALEITRRLAEICGPPFARFAGAADEVAGRTARWVAVPGGPRAAAEVLRLAAAHGLTVVPRGAGTKIDWGAAPEQVDIMLDTGRLAGVWHEAQGSALAEVGAGTPLRAVQAALERTGRRLPVDAPSPGATLGGVLAADEAGPLRHRHGTPCAQLVGVRYLDAEGELVSLGEAGTAPLGRAAPARSGVAHPGAAALFGRGELPGLDLARLLCGSQGGLGVLVSATLRVQAVPASRVWVSRPVWTPLEVHDLVRAVLGAGLDPAAVELDLPVPVPLPRRRVSPFHPSVVGRPDHPALTGRSTRPAAAGSLVVLLEGGPAQVAERADRLVEVLGDEAVVSHAAPEWWGRYPFAPGDTALRIEVPINDLHAAVYALRDAAGGPVPVRGSAGVGTVHAALPGTLPPERVASILSAVRGVLLARQGRCVVVSAPGAIRRAVDLWGELPTLSRLRAVKAHLDPSHRLAPGRLPGGL